MEIIAGLSVAALVLVAFFVATRTFMLWLRTRALPELLLSTYLFCATVLGYPITIASSRVSPSEMWLLHFGGNVVMSLGFTCLLLFTLEVFRPGALWARLAVGACLAAFVSAAVIYYRELSGAHPRAAAELFELNLIATLPIAFAYFWTTTESLLYHRQLKLRLRLGLSEVAVVNRVLLWGAMTFSAGLAVALSLVGMLQGSFMSTPMVLAFSCLGIVHAGCLLFAFHPPRWYTAWLEQGAPAQAR